MCKLSISFQSRLQPRLIAKCMPRYMLTTEVRTILQNGTPRPRLAKTCICSAEHTSSPSRTSGNRASIACQLRSTILQLHASTRADRSYTCLSSAKGKTPTLSGLGDEPREKSAVQRFTCSIVSRFRQRFPPPCFVTPLSVMLCRCLQAPISTIPRPLKSAQG